jgi:hypothetical protein
MFGKPKPDHCPLQSRGLVWSAMVGYRQGFLNIRRPENLQEYEKAMVFFVMGLISAMNSLKKIFAGTPHLPSYDKHCTPRKQRMKRP